MTDKDSTLDPGWTSLPAEELDALHAQLKQARELYAAMLAELNDLRAERERLTLADRQWADHVKRLAEENERLRAALELCRADHGQAAQAAPSPAADP